MEFVLVNGEVTTRNEADFSGFAWNNALTIAQNVWFGYGGIPLLEENVTNLQLQLQSLGSELPPLFQNKRELFRLCKRVLNKNKFYRSGHLRFQFVISENEVAYIVSAINYEGSSFPNPAQGLLINVSPHRKVSTSSINRLRCHNRTFWKAAEVDNKNEPHLTPVFLNEKDMVCEGPAANIFLLKKKVLVTPSLESGCFEDVLRKIIIEQAAALKVQVIESDEIDVKMLRAADELFLASEARGIEWIMGIENKRFVRKFSIQIAEKTDDFLKEKVGH